MNSSTNTNRAMVVAAATCISGMFNNLWRYFVNRLRNGYLVCVLCVAIAMNMPLR
jgi:hypothetical protein